MNPPGSSSRRPPLAGCSFPRASSDPRGGGPGPAGPAPARALARAPPCRLLVLLLLPPLAASSWPRAWGAAAPSGGYGPGALCMAWPAGPCKGKKGRSGPCAPDTSRLGLSAPPCPLSTFLILRPHLSHCTFRSSFALRSPKSRFLSVPRGGIQWGLCPAVPLGCGEPGGWGMQRGSKLLLGWWSLTGNAEGCDGNSGNGLFPQSPSWVYSLLPD